MNQLKSSDFDDSSNKGYEFECFVVSRFNQEYFKLIDSRSDKYYDGIYPLSNLNPDLKYRFKSTYKTVEFAVECKWRKSFFNNEINWAKKYQIRNYNEYKQTQNIPVYIILGIGGQPNLPSEMYIVPLNDIETTWLNKKFLSKYKRHDPEQMFFLELDSLILR